MNEHQLVKDYSEQIANAFSVKGKLFVCGGRSKEFLVRTPDDIEILNLSDYCGIINYEPSELVITVRAGTRLQSVESMLSSKGQCFPFDPPMFNNNATIGGMVASGLSGSARPYSGSLRDAVLGVKMLNGKGELLQFGGQVIKNVAGFDLSRVMSGSFGSLGAILEVSLKVVPKPKTELTVAIKVESGSMLNVVRELHSRIRIITGLAALDDVVYCRVAGGEAAVNSTADMLPGDIYSNSGVFWTSLKNHQLGFFRDNNTLWRVSLPPAAQALAVDAESVLDWGGALRWLKTEQTTSDVIEAAKAVGGSAYQFKVSEGRDRLPLFHLPSGLAALHERLRNSFDPGETFDASALYSGVT